MNKSSLMLVGILFEQSRVFINTLQRGESMKRKLWKEIMVAVLLVSSILSFSPIAYGETTSIQQSIDAVKMEMKKAALSYVEPALKGELVPSSSLDSVLNSVKKNYQETRKIILASNLSEKEKQAKLKELDALYEEKIVKGLIRIHRCI